MIRLSEGLNPPSIADRDHPGHPGPPKSLLGLNEHSFRGLAEIIVAKHRQGETGTVQLTWSGTTTSFRNRALSAPAGPDPF